MKKIYFLFIILILTSCEMGFKEILVIDKSPLAHAKLGFELDKPDSVLNELTKGEINKHIYSILLMMYGNTGRKWEFEYVDNSDKISKMIFYLPHYKHCEKNVYQFYYNSENLIDSVVSIRKNLCNEYEVIETYTFNYDETGLLNSIFMDNDYFVEENYFGYYPNGKIKEIYNDFRGRGIGPNFGVQKFYYDSSFTNVIKVDHISGSNYHYTYQYFYDNNENPYKDFFIAVSVFMPYIGPAYLSENNVIKMIEKNENNIYGNEFSYEYVFNYSNTNKLNTYFDTDAKKVYSINQ